MFAIYAKKINEALANPSIKFICKAIAALISHGQADDFLMSLGKQLETRPLTDKQKEAAVKSLRRKIGTLAKLAVAASKATAPIAPETAATPEPAPEPVKPSALPPRGQKRPSKAKQPKQPKLPKPELVKTGREYVPTPDINGLPPWEHDDLKAA